MTIILPIGLAIIFILIFKIIKIHREIEEIQNKMIQMLLNAKIDAKDLPEIFRILD